MEGDSISRKAELTRVEQVNPSLANNSPEGHLHTALGPGAKTHMWEQSIFLQGLSMPIWSDGWMICKPYRVQESGNVPSSRYQVAAIPGYQFINMHLLQVHILMRRKK